MRVKKLSVNRRHKQGDDEAAIGGAAGGDSDQRRWVSPTKPLRPGAAVSASTSSSSGASSPTDVQQQQQHLGEHSPLQFQTSNSSELFSQRGAGGAAAAMPNAAVADVVMQEDGPDKNPLRKAMVDKIVETLRALKPHAPEKVLAALPRLAQHMEKALYKLAKNEAEYRDASTLRLRIARIQESNAKRLLTQQQQTPEQSSNANAVAPPLKPLTEEQAALVFQHLQSWRQKLVNMYGVAPWDILPNPTLAKVALYMPSTEQELTACGVGNEQVARFGSSLVQELQRLRGPARPTKPANRSIKAKQPRKPSPGKRGSSEPQTAASNKKRKNGEAARLAPAAPNFNGTSLMAPAPLLPAVDSLPTLLPTVSMMPGGVTGSSSATSNAMAMKQTQFTSTAVRLSPAQIPQQPFFARLQPQQQQQQPQQQGSPSPAQESHMHLLAQGAGQLSKQQSGKSLEAYEQEVQSLRWMLHQSQEERSRLEAEVQHLRAQLQGVNGSK
ncbi:CMGC protein kinase [Phytophthora cinnamomi]|uniref:CMGC protein kinase n=1 Tax=Phytophthora cinnamomi TaxID=4785 RepID=UPI0035598856|nr:CMGC protein kinase [Phytophthora cinnamomi]